jgi:hypothetical protein
MVEVSVCVCVEAQRNQIKCVTRTSHLKRSEEFAGTDDYLN